MPKTRLLLYREDDGTIPLLEWFDNLSNKAVVKCRARMDQLEKQGYELRRPIADYLKDGIYELRASLQGIHFRILYFFHKNTAVVLSHGLAKEQCVPPEEIDLALKRKKRFGENPEKHSYEEINYD